MFLTIPMSIIGHMYKLPNSPSTISRHDSCIYDCGRIDGSIAYPSCETILAKVSAKQGVGKSLEECYNRDVLFRFAIRGHIDRIARRGRIGNDPVLDHIVRIGLYDWSGLTGGKGVFTQQAHGEFIVSSETKCPPNTQQAHGEHF